LHDFITTGRIRQNELFVLDSLLCKMKNEWLSRGRQRDYKKVDELLVAYQKELERQSFAADIEDQRYVISENLRTFFMKYMAVFVEQQENYGIVDIRRINDPQTLKYATLDHKEKVGEEYHYGMKMEEYYKQLFRFMISMYYLLNYHRNISSIYKFDIDDRDIAVLIGRMFSTNGYTEVSTKNMIEHLNMNFTDIERQKLFFERVISKKTTAPIMLKLYDIYLVGKATLTFYIMYLVYLHDKTIVQEGKERSSIVFEDVIREQLKKVGYTVPFLKEFKLSKKSPWSYDIIAYSTAKNEAVLIEAKYKDLSPSSRSPTTLLEQELYDKDKGLLGEAERHIGRVNFFNENVAEFSKAIGNDLSGFKISGLIVTKYTPIIYRHNNINILSYAEFEKSFMQ